MRLTTGIIGLLLSSASALAAPPEPEQYHRLNQALIEQHVLPRYRALASATAELAERAGRFGSAPDESGLASVREGFHIAADAWQAIQHVRFGPVELFLRGRRFAFWPDPRDTVGRGMAPILAEQDRQAISAQSFAAGSVAIQGLPALERLLFDDGADARLLADDAAARFRCDYLRAVADNLADMAAGILSDWTGGDAPFAAVLGDTDSGDTGSGSRYREPREVTVELFKSLHLALELVAEHKLARPLGGGPGTARVQLTESWRSGRSLANIRHNLEAAAAMYLGEQDAVGFAWLTADAAGDRELDALLRRAFTQTLATAASIESPLSEALTDPVQRPRVEQLALETSALRQLLARRLSNAIGVPLGFNAMDGD